MKTTSTQCESVSAGRGLRVRFVMWILFVALVPMILTAVLGYVIVNQFDGHPIQRLSALGGLMLIIGSAAFVIAQVIARRLFRPIKNMAKIASGVAQGDYQQLCVVDSKDELGDLARSINQMISSMGTTISELEYRKKSLNEHAIVSITDIGGKIIYANQLFCELSGYTLEELIGQTHRIVKSDEHPPEFYKELWKTVSSGEPWSGEIKNRCKDGSFYWVSATIVPFKDSAGKIIKYVAIRTDITALKEVQNQLEEGNISLSFALESEQETADKLEEALADYKVLATTDKLTGLPNRGVFVERLYEMMSAAKNGDVKFAVLFFDFDRFKVINDSLGHEVGDELLCDIAKIFNHELRSVDLAARFGGDEFVVILGGLKEWDDAIVTGQRLLELFAEPHELSGHQVVSTASIGIVTNERTYADPGEMIRDADVAMFKAKDDGKNTMVVFNQAMHEEAMDRLVIESGIREALDKNQFRLMYQPIVVLETGVLKGFEALIRWDHPERGLIGPDSFISIAEDTGLINEIGEWILHEAGAQIREWNHTFGAHKKLSMNVNVSKRQLLAPDFMDKLIACQDQYDLNHCEFQIEITESVIVDSRSNVIPLLNAIREQGIPIVMDDFGTGVSSLSTLHSYPIDVLKIDQSFIRVLDGDRSLLAVVTAIAALADNLGIRTVAEGVESVDIIGALQSVGCTWGQGYYFAKPLTVDEANDFILDNLGVARVA
jgi:diguanylate cyclase (GGDEF)-like protein/PAS domain S-box-containing protein